MKPPSPPKAHLLFALAFLPVAAALLAIDSEHWLGSVGFDGQWLVNVIVPLWLLAMLRVANRELRMLMMVMVPLSLVGEIICSPLLGMYEYRHHNIPFYIPFGHAVVYGTCGMIATFPQIHQHRQVIRRTLTVFFVGLMTTVIVLFNDTLTLALGIAMFIALYLRGWSHFYLIMGVMVLSIELLGTSFGCWVWAPQSLGILHTVNPPVGAIGIYIMGDMGVQWVAKRILNRNAPSPALAEPQSASTPTT